MPYRSAPLRAQFLDLAGDRLRALVHPTSRGAARAALCLCGVLLLSTGVTNLSARRSALQHQTPLGASSTRFVSGVNYGRLPLIFEPNRGQADDKVRFVARGEGNAILLTETGPIFSVRRDAAAKQNSALQVQLLKSNPDSQLSATDQLAGKVNYLRGKDRSKWLTGLPTYAKVRQDGVYPGIDLVYYGNQRQLEYDFIVSPGTDPRAIQMSLTGARVSIDRSTGDLIASVGYQQVRLHKPIAYQKVGDHRQSVPARYILDSRHRLSIAVGSYDRKRALVIDPTVSYSTYLGGNSNDYGTSVAVDAAGNAYVTGYTNSTNFAVTSGAFQIACGGACANSTVDAFVSKLDPTGSFLIYSTYIGGSGNDYGNGISLDSAGNAYIVGQTFSSDFPVTTGAFQTACGGGSCTSGDAFVAELDSTGSTLLYSTYLGGTGINQANAIVLDASNNAYVTGYTYALDFPVTTGAYQTTCTCSLRPDVFVTELNSAGSALVYSTYLGGSDADFAYAIALDASNNAYITGYTHSTDFPTTAGAFQTTTGANSAGFIASLNPTGTALNYSTYLGGSTTATTPCETCATTIAVDSEGNAYVGGLTAESNFPITPGAFQSTFKSSPQGHDAFITKLNPGGTALVFSTFVGGTGDDGATTVALDGSGDVWFKGNTKSTDFPTTAGAYQTVSGGLFDAYVAELDPTGSKLLYSTYLGGTGTEYGGATRAMMLDAQNPPNVYVTGYTNSTNFPVTSATLQQSTGGANDVYIAKIVPSPNVGLSAGLSFGNQNDGTTSAPLTMTLTNTGNTDLTISDVSVTGTNSGDFAQTNTCSTVPAQSTCSISVTFTPTLSATETADISITDNAPGSPQLGSLTGVGVGSGSGPVVGLSPASLSFASQLVNTSSASQTVTLSNTGSSSLSITSITISGDFTQVNTCGASVAAGANCTITITFKPTKPNTRTGTVTINDNATGGVQTVALTGTGTFVALSPTSLSFGSVTVGSSSSPQSATFTNDTKTAMTIKSVKLTGTNVLDFTETNTCGTSVAAGKNCTITVTFKPKATGTRSASVSITDSGGGSPQSISLTGTGK